MSIISLIFGVLLAALLLFILYRLYVYKKGLKINVFYNKKSKIAPLVSSIQALKKPYHPTPWLFNCHAQTLYSMQFRKRKNFKNERETVSFPDGGNAIIDWFHPTTIHTVQDGDSSYEKKEDIIILLHTLGGGSREKVINAFGVQCAKRGFTAAVLNCRGCAGAKFTSPRTYNAYEIEDFKYSIDNYIKKRNPRHIFICGFSMGAMHATEYAMQFPEDITAIVAVSHTMDVEKATKQLDDFPLNKFYLPNIMQSHYRLLKKQPYFNKPELLKIKSMVQFDTEYTAPSIGMKSCNDYWAHITIFNKIPKFGTPILELVAEDDPFTKKSYFPFKEAEQDNNQYMVLVTTKEGGHCGFIEGMDGEHTLVEDIAFEWFEKVVQMHIK